MGDGSIRDVVGVKKLIVGDAQLKAKATVTAQQVAAALASEAVDQCTRETPWKAMWSEARSDGKVWWTCAHLPPHETEAK
jgi:hypothetical protein